MHGRGPCEITCHVQPPPASPCESGAGGHGSDSFPPPTTSRGASECSSAADRPQAAAPNLRKASCAAQSAACTVYGEAVQPTKPTSMYRSPRVIATPLWRTWPLCPMAAPRGGETVTPVGSKKVPVAQSGEQNRVSTHPSLEG